MQPLSRKIIIVLTRDTEISSRNTANIWTVLEIINKGMKCAINVTNLILIICRVTMQCKRIKEVIIYDKILYIFVTWL
jgi:hypothetical protein